MLFVNPEQPGVPLPAERRFLAVTADVGGETWVDVSNGRASPITVDGVSVGAVFPVRNGWQVRVVYFSNWTYQVERVENIFDRSCGVGLVPRSTVRGRETGVEPVRLGEVVRRAGTLESVFPERHTVLSPALDKLCGR